MAMPGDSMSGMPGPQPSITSREVDETLRTLLDGGQKFQTGIVNMPGFFLDLPNEQDDQETAPPSYAPQQRDNQPSAPNPLRRQRTFWKVSEPLCSDPVSGSETTRPTNDGDALSLSLSLQRTQLYTNGEIGFLPIMGNQMSEDPTTMNSYESAIWGLFAVLECSGLRRFTIDRQWGDTDNSLYGGRENVAEGASYRIGTRFRTVRGQQKLVAVKKVKESLAMSGSAPENRLATTTLETIRKDIVLMTRPQYRRMAGHPHILPCLGYGWEAGGPAPSLFLVVPWAQRGTLRQFLKNKDISWPIRKELFNQVCLGLRSLHRYDIAHGDVKMENVLIFNRPHLETEEGRRSYEESRRKYPQVPPIEENVTVKLSDFGCSVSSLDDRYTGTAAYNAPEVRNGTLNMSRFTGKMTKFIKCDIFSAGLLFLELLLGGESVASHSRVQNMTCNADGVLPALEFARETASEELSHPWWRGRQLAIARDLFLQIFEATLKYDPEERFPVDYLLKVIEQATWRATFNSDDHPILQDLFAPSDQTLHLYDPIHQLLGQLYQEQTDQLSNRQIAGIDIEAMPRAMVSQLFASWYNSTVNQNVQAASKAADFLINSCFDRTWTKVTTVNDFISMLDKFVRLGRGKDAALVYYRLLNAFNHDIPVITVSDPKCQHILDLERELLASGPGEDVSYQYRRTMAYRAVMRSRTRDALELLGVQEDRFRPAARQEDLLSHPDDDAKGLYDDFGVIAWLCQIDSGPVLRQVLAKHREVINGSIEVAFKLVLAASKSGHLENLKCILETAQLSFAGFVPPHGLTPLHFLAMFEASHVHHVISILTDAGFDINAHIELEEGFRIDFWPEIKFWSTPMSVAIMHNREDVVHALLENKADLEPRGKFHSSPVNIAAQFNRPHLLEILLPHLKGLRALAFSPLRTLSTSCPFAQELANGASRVRALEQTIDVLVKFGFDIQETTEVIQSINYAADCNVFEKAIRECDFTVDFSVLDALLDKGFNLGVSGEDLAMMLVYHHEAIQIRLVEYLVRRQLIRTDTFLSKVRLVYNMVYREMAGALRAVFNQLPEYISVISRMEHPILQLPLSIGADRETIDVLLEYGASASGPWVVPEPTGRPPQTILEFVLNLGRGDIIDAFLDREVNCPPEVLLRLCSSLDNRVNGLHVLAFMLRRSNPPAADFRHPAFHNTLTHEINGRILHNLMLSESTKSLNIDAILALLSADIPIDASLHHWLTLSLLAHALLATCASETTRTSYLSNKGFENPLQLQVSVWKLLVHLTSKAQPRVADSGGERGYSYLHWACMMASPEITRDLLDAGADVFAETEEELLPVHVVGGLYGDIGEESKFPIVTTLSQFEYRQLATGSGADMAKTATHRALFGSYTLLARKYATVILVNDRMMCELARGTEKVGADQAAEFFQCVQANELEYGQELENLAYAQAWWKGPIVEGGERLD
ncbi:hypothetical protein QBC43DRAFT_125325 [Cladorrhinum sp. PSN259]|nr:hypothetical protein QBC43DRAFT_125325 [Cladorrhinum sp. PSN259]